MLNDDFEEAIRRSFARAEAASPLPDDAAERIRSRLYKPRTGSAPKVMLAGAALVLAVGTPLAVQGLKGSTASPNKVRLADYSFPLQSGYQQTASASGTCQPLANKALLPPAQMSASTLAPGQTSTTSVTLPPVTAATTPLTAPLNQPASTLVTQPASTLVTQPASTLVTQPASTLVSEPATTLAASPFGTPVAGSLQAPVSAISGSLPPPPAGSRVVFIKGKGGCFSVQITGPAVFASPLAARALVGPGAKALKVRGLSGWVSVGDSPVKPSLVTRLGVKVPAAAGQVVLLKVAAVGVPRAQIISMVSAALAHMSSSNGQAQILAKRATSNSAKAGG